jgi:hypothetical protein
MVRRRKIKTVIPKEISQTAMITGSTPNEWGKSEQRRYEARKYFRKIRGSILIVQINDLQISNKNKNTRELYAGINEFKNDY